MRLHQKPGTLAGLFCGILLAVAMTAPSMAFAAPSKEAYCITGNKITYYDSLQAAWVAAGNGSTVGITKDVELGKSVLTNSKGTVNLELNGHKLYKDKEKQSNIFDVGGGSTLNVYGGRLNWTVNGDSVTKGSGVISGARYDSDTGLATNSYDSKAISVRNASKRLYFYGKASNGSWITTTMNGENCTYTGGMISGGYSSGDGGAFRLVGDSAKLNLFNVYLVGNAAVNNGGAIAMSGKYQRVELDNSVISFNRAVDKNGGGVYMGGDYGRLILKNSHIDFNLADDNGGGVSATGEKCSIIGDAKAVDPSDKAYPASSEWKNTDKYNASTFYNPYFVKDQMFAYEFLRTEGHLSTIAMNIVPDCDLNGGGGGVHVGSKDMSVAGLNIFRNYAGGSGVTSTWRGRGGGVEMKKVGNSLYNCNIWKNWSRSEGGGVYVDNDKCSVSNVTVTENYAHSNGWSGGGVYVLGSVNLAISGVCRIWSNTSAESGNTPHSDNLYLGYYNTMYARLYPKLAKGSKVYLWMTGAGTTITKIKGDYDERMFYADKNNWHVEYTPEKILKLVEGKSNEAYLAERFPALPTAKLTPDGSLTAGSRTKKTDKSFKLGDKSFPVYQGVAELPAFDDTAKDYTSTFFYSDGYFFGDPKAYEPHLATLSIHLAASAFYSNDGNQGGVLHGAKKGIEGKNYTKEGTFYPVKSNNIRQFLSDIGVEEKDIYLNDFNIEKPQADTIGVAIGSKVLKNADGTKSNKTLVVVGVRGAGYEQEWISNLTLGRTGEAQGFSSAAKQVFAELNKYLKLKGIDGRNENTIFWVAGYSRAGATSNLTGKRIVDAYDKNCKHTFVYTFEAPQGGSREDANGNTTIEGLNTNNYTCIHNVINDVDIVPKVGPSNMGFFRYGVDHYVPGGGAGSSVSTTTTYYNTVATTGASYTTWRDNTIDKPGSSSYETQKNKMITQLHAISGYNIIFNDYYHAATMSFLANKLWGGFGVQLIDETNTSKVPADAGAFGTGFLNDLMKQEFRFTTNKTKNLANSDKFYRYNYSVMSRGGTTFEQAISKAAGVVFALTPAQMEGLMGISDSIMDRIDTTDFYLKFLNGSRSANDVADEIWKSLTKETAEGRAKGYVYLQDYLTADQLKTLGDAFPALCDVLLNYLKDDYSKTGCIQIGTFAYNAMRILSAHYPEVSIAWVRSYDDYYNGESAIYSVADSAKITSAGGWHVAPKLVALSYDNPYVELHVVSSSGQDPENPDEDKGASLFYSLDGEVSSGAIHPYCGPIKLSASETESVQHTIKAFSIHDGIMTAEQNIRITVEKPDQITWPVYTENPEGSGTYSIEKKTAKTTVGSHYEFKAPERIGSQSFKGWKVKYSHLDPTSGKRVYSEFSINTGAERLKNTLYTYLEGLNLAEPSVSFVVKGMGQYEFEADYADAKRYVTAYLPKVEKGKPLPATSSVRIEQDATVEAATEWALEDDGVYIVRITLPQNYSYQNDLRATVERNADNAPGRGDVVVMRSGNPQVTRSGDKTIVSQQVKLSGYKEPAPEPSGHAVTLQAYDLNLKQLIPMNKSAVVIKDENDNPIDNPKAGQKIKIQLPKSAVDGFAYLRMLKPSETNIAVTDTAKLHGFAMVEDDANYTFSFEMIDGGVSLVAGCVPLVSKASVMLDSNLQAGKARPNVKWVDLTIGTGGNASVWRVESGFSETWEPKAVQAKGSMLDFGKSYELTLIRSSNGKEPLKGQLISPASTGIGSAPLAGQAMPLESTASGSGEGLMGQQLVVNSTGGESREMTGEFKFVKDVVLEIRHGDETTSTGIETAGSHSTQNRWGSLISYKFKKTGEAQIVEVLDPEPIVVPYTDAPNTGVLPNTADVVFEGGSVQKVPVSWGELEVETYGDPVEDGYVAWAEGTLTSTEFTIPDELDTVLGTIVVEGKPQAEEPWGYLNVGNAGGPAEDYVGTISVGADGSTSVKLELFAEEGSFITYNVSGSEGWSHYNDSDGIEIGWGDNPDVPDGAAKSVTVQARAGKDGCLDSETVTYEFKLFKVPSTVMYTVKTRAVCGETELFATTTGGGQYLSGIPVYITAPESFAVRDVVYSFDHWSVADGQATLTDPNAASTWFSMPKRDVTATAVYKELGTVAQPSPSLMPGSYTLKADEADKQLAFNAMEGAEVYYTIASGDAEPADPTTQSAIKYTTPIALTVSAGQTSTYKVKAIAVKKTAGGSEARSSVASFAYTITRPKPSYLVSVSNGSIVNAVDATRVVDGGDESDGSASSRATFVAGSKVTVVADDAVDQTFKEWKAEGLALAEADKSKARMTFTMPENKVTLEATYEDKVSTIKIAGFDGKKFSDTIDKRPTSVSYTTNVSDSAIKAPLAWDKGETVTNDDGSKTTSWTVSFTVTNAKPGFAEAVQVTGDEGWTVTKATGTSVTAQKQVSYKDDSTKVYEVKVLCYDANINQVVETFAYDFIQTDLENVNGKLQIFLDAPAVEDEQFDNWMTNGESLSGLNDASSGWNDSDYAQVYADATAHSTEGATIVFPSDQTKTKVVVVAKYIPVINWIDIDVDEPIAGEALAEYVNMVQAVATEVYFSLPVGEGEPPADVDLADMLDLKWYVLGESGNLTEATGQAKHNTTYTAMMSLKDAYKSKVKFVLDPDTIVAVNDEYLSYEELEFDGGTSGFAGAKLYTEFSTEKERLLAISAPAELTVNNSDVSAWPLPATVGIITEVGTGQAPVTWNLAGLVLDDAYTDGATNVEVYRIPGEVNLPSSIDAGGCSLSVSLVVRSNQPVPVSASPKADPKPGTYQAKQRVELSAAEGADIYYTFGEGDPVDGQLYLADTGIVLAGDSDGDITSTIRAVAVERGKRPSPVAEFAYTILQPKPAPGVVDKSALEDAIAAAKKVADGVKTSPDGKDVEPSEKYTTAAERQALEDAIAAAQKILDNPNSSQEDVDKATAALKDATDAFNKAKKAGNKPKGNPGKDPSPSLEKGASAVAADKAITSMKDDADPAGTTIAPLKLRSVKQGKNSIKVQWGIAPGAKTYVLYGNECGKKNGMKKLGTTAGTSFYVKKVGDKKLRVGKYHKFIVVALDQNNNVVSASKVIHVSTKGSKKRANPKKVTVTKRVIKQAKKMKQGKKLKLGAKVVAPKNSKVKVHVAMRYESSNPAVAKVSKKGVVRAKSKGQAKIIAYAQNGVSRTLTVVVK